MNIRTVLVSLAACAVLAACSSVPYGQRLAARQSEVLAAAGAPVNSFRYFNDMYSWEPLGDTQLVVYTRPNEAYLLDLGMHCQDLTTDIGIGLTSSFNQVTVRFDRVLTGRQNIPCVIEKIRPIDVTRLHEAQKERRKIESAPRPDTQAQPAG